MANRSEDRDIPAQPGHDRGEEGAGMDERGRADEEIRGIAEEGDEELEETDELDTEEEDADEGSF